MQQDILIGAGAAQPLRVKRFGYGTMRLTGEGIYGEPANRPEAIKVLQRAIEAGINFLDTADYYGEDVTNRLIKEALYPYPADLVICTKVGATRKPDKSWVPFNRPEDLRTAIEKNLSTLKTSQVQLVHFRVMPHSDVPFRESMDAMFQMQQEGLILHVGVSNVTREELVSAMELGPVSTVENMYGHAQRTTLRSPHGENRGGEEVLDLCEENQVPLIPYFSLFTSVPKKDARISEVAKKYGVTDIQVNIAWLLHRSPWILPIPGTSSLAHFEENRKASELQLSPEDMEYLD